MNRLVLSLCLIGLTGCGNGGPQGGGGAQAVLQFRNGKGTTSQGLSSISQRLANRGPDVFGMKLLAVYLTGDIDPTTQSNVGPTAMIYENPLCQNDIMHCDISGGTAEDGQPLTHIVTDFFDFAASSDSVNAAINAQGRAIEPATYKYARIEFCKMNQQSAANIRWAADGGAVRSFKRNSCTMNSRVFDPPLVVGADESVTVTLGYDLSAQVFDKTPSNFGDDCSSEVCFNVPNFVPSAALAR